MLDLPLHAPKIMLLFFEYQVGDESPDVTPEALAGAWEATQQLLRSRHISAGHDISDGGAAVALLEMAFAGNTGIEVHAQASLRWPIVT